jgi:16S rRNA G527 N7-methylase RsmG
MKGKNPEEEINGLIKGWAVAQIKKIDVPYLDAERHIITITRKK